MLPSDETLSTLLGSLYDAASDASRWEPFLQQLAEASQAHAAGLVMHEVGPEAHTVAKSWNLDPEGLALYEQHYGTVDIWAMQAWRVPTAQPFVSQALCPREDFVKTEIYNDFMVRFGIEHGMFGMVENTQSRKVSVSLYRDRSGSEFSPSDLDILRFLRPHIQRAFKLHSQFASLQARSAGFEAALDMHPAGVIFLGAEGQVVLMNRAASAFVSERDGLLANHDGLRAERPAESALLQKAIRQAASTSNGNGLSAGGTVLVSRRTRPPLQILVSPIGNSAITSQAVAAIAFITDPAQRQRPTRDVLKARFGLTPAECRVAMLSSDGHAPRQIANMIGVTDHTVRSQIKSIFSKTGVKRQGELIRLLLNHSAVANPGERAAL
jgi:DNA-binding CsgD family transcriptional regulator